MRVKVGDTWYSDRDFPIMVELTDQDQMNMRKMPNDANKYASHRAQKSLSEGKLKDWMRQ